MSQIGGHFQLQFGTSTIEYELTFSERKTLAIHVYPDSSVVVDAPLGTDIPSVDAKVRKRAAWILRQQRQFETFAKPNPLPRRYVSGESYRYLGRQYRLKVEQNAVSRVVLSRGYLTISLPTPADKDQIADLLDGWYKRHARRVFEERLKVCYPRVEALGIPYPRLSMRDMKSRWGSCTAAGQIILNLKLIQVPKDLIDYVILHELCHLKEHNHSPIFYALLSRVLPDWETYRQRLNSIELSTSSR
jgi:predicted metal-dependent hydrolase